MSSPESSSSSDDDYERLAKRRRTRVIGEFMASHRATVKQASGPRGPKKHVNDAHFVWKDHVDSLSPNAFRRRYRMDTEDYLRFLGETNPPVFF